MTHGLPCLVHKDYILLKSLRLCDYPTGPRFKAEVSSLPDHETAALWCRSHSPPPCTPVLNEKEEKRMNFKLLR